MSERRPIERADYERAYAVLHALQMAREEPTTPAWEHLMFLHEERVEDDAARVPSVELAGDSGFNAEHQRALILLEVLKMGGTTVPVDVGPTQHRCATPGCRQPTTGVLCPSCELAQGPRS